MKGKKILFISSEVVPYMPQTEISTLTYALPKLVNENGGQTRIFIPKYGNINERRHQLHEVIRLSGINLIIDDMDMPLILKVASIPKERMQVYFIDSEDYFKAREGYSKDLNNKLYVPHITKITTISIISIYVFVSFKHHTVSNLFIFLKK